MPDGTLVLTDWKTGRDDDQYETELQMAAYVLWAREYYKMSADEIRTELVFLKTGATKPYAFFEKQLREVQEMISREFAATNASYEYGDFPAWPSQREYLSCRFVRFCARDRDFDKLLYWLFIFPQKKFQTIKFFSSWNH